jgi:hypothetical protein
MVVSGLIGAVVGCIPQHGALTGLLLSVVMALAIIWRVNPQCSADCKIIGVFIFLTSPWIFLASLTVALKPF